jgi:aminoglycoside phosphotransferase
LVLWIAAGWGLRIVTAMLPLMCDSISECFGAKWVSPFLTHYGVTKPNHEKLKFYRRLDAFY